MATIGNAHRTVIIIGTAITIKLPFAERTRIHETDLGYGAVGSEVGLRLVLASP
jgi:hypothetical protein